MVEALGAHFRDSGYSLAELIRLITASQVYQLSSEINQRNAADNRNYSRHYRTRLRAEVLRDAFTQVSGIEPRFAATPPGANAKQIWTHRTKSLFLDTFGRPDPNQDPPCERMGDSTVVQSLHLMNSKEMHADLVNDEGNVAKLAASDSTAPELTDHIYRLVYGRRPTDDEIDLVVQLLSEPNADRRVVIEDVVWAMINSPEFVFQN